MKKLVLLAGVLFAVACTAVIKEDSGKEESPNVVSEPQTYEYTIEASLDQDFTKSSYDSEGKFTWSDGDKISVLFHDGSTNKFFTLTVAAGGNKTATFSGPVTVGFTEGSSDATTEYWAVFPASDEHTFTAGGVDNPISFYIPAEKDFTEVGAHFSADLPLGVKSASAGTYTFKNLCGAYKFTFKDLNVSKVKFTVYNDGRELSGRIRLDKGVALKQTTPSREEDKSLTFIANVDGEGKASFYVPYRGWTKDFQPMFSLKEADTDYTLYAKSARSAFSNDRLGLESGIKMVVLPEMSAPGVPPVPEPEPDFSSRTHITYTESSAHLLNPERGFYKQHSDIKSASTPVTRERLSSYRAEGYTLVYVGFYLTDFMGGSISDAYLSMIRTSLGNFRSEGMKCILRFAYKDGHDEGDKPFDPVKSVLLGHISQIKPILEDYKDVIFVQQCGFIGSWGEWYYTTNYADDADRKAVVDALLAALPSERQLELRIPAYKMRLYDVMVTDTLTAATAHNGSVKSRLAGHNDCFGASSTDSGTFGNFAGDRLFWKAESRYTIMGGETCAVSDYCLCNNTKRDLEDYHWTYLNSGWNEDVTNRWKTDGCSDEIADRLGYRLVLKDAYYTASPVAGETFDLALRIQNKGYAAPMNPRQAKLVFVAEDSTVSEFELGSDPRTWHSGTRLIQTSFTLPAAKGTLYLKLSDPLIPDDPRYSIACANTGVFESATGYNKLLEL